MMRNAPSGFTLIHIASVEAVPDARAWSAPREPSKEPVMNEFTDPCLDQSRHRSWPQKSDMGLDQLVMIGTRTRALQCQSVRSTAAQADVSIPEELNATHLHGGVYANGGSIGASESRFCTPKLPRDPVLPNPKMLSAS